MQFSPSTFHEERAQRRILFEAIQKGNSDLLLQVLESYDAFENRMHESSLLAFSSGRNWNGDQSEIDICTDTQEAIKAQLLRDPNRGVQLLQEQYSVLLEAIARAILHNYDLVQDALALSWYKVYDQLEKAKVNPELLEADTHQPFYKGEGLGGCGIQVLHRLFRISVRPEHLDECLASSLSSWTAQEGFE